MDLGTTEPGRERGGRPGRGRTRAPIRFGLLVPVALASCASVPEHPEPVARFLDRPATADAGERALTGVWTDDAGARIALVQAGELVAVMPLGGDARSSMHFGEGRIDGARITLLAYRQAVATDSSVGGLDVVGLREATLHRDDATLAWLDGSRWRRSESVPGTGALTGLWRTVEGELVAVAHEADHLLAFALGDDVRLRFTVAHGRVAGDGRVWTMFVRDGFPAARGIGRPARDGLSIDWPDGRWQLEERLRGAPPAPPTLLGPADRATLPNAVDGTLRWTFDWSDVAGASEYRIEVTQEDARRSFIAAEGLADSSYTHEARGGFVSRTEGWSWRVAAKVAGEWTDWSPRSRFRVEAR